MKIRSLSVNQFMKFDRPTKLEGLSDGLNVIVGPNEMGKSTLLAALRAAFFEKYGSKSKEIRKLQNCHNLAAPVVSVRFEIDGDLYEIRKRFMKKAYATLICHDGRNLEGDAAEQELQNLILSGGAGSSGKSADSFGMWNVLWVQQGKSFAPINLSDHARSSLHNALETEVGTVLGGRRGRELPKKFENHRSQLVTAGASRPTGHYKNLIEQSAKLESEISELNDRRNELTEYLEILESAQSKLDRLESDNSETDDLRKISQAQIKHQELARHEEKIRTARSELDRMSSDLQRLENEAKEYHRLNEAIRDAKNRHELASQELETLRAREKVNVQQAESVGKKLQDAAVWLEISKENEQEAQRVLAAVRSGAEILDLERRFKDCKQAEERYQENLQRVASILVDDESLKRIRVAKRELDIAKSSIQQSATRIQFDLDEGGAEGIEIEGQPLPSAQQAYDIIEKTEISIPERGKIYVHPAVNDQDSLVANRREASRTLESELRAVQADSAEHAEQLHVERQVLAHAAESARQEAARHASNSDSDAVGAQTLEVRINKIRQTLENEKNAFGISDLPSVREAEEYLFKMRNDTELARSDVSGYQTELKTFQSALSEIKIQIATVESNLKNSVDLLKKHEFELDLVNEQKSESEVQIEIQAMNKQISVQQQLVNQLEAKHEESDLKMLEVRIDRLKTKIQNRQKKRDDLTIQVASLKNTIGNLEGAGVDEKIQQKQREREVVNEELTRCKREVEVLDLLLLTLRKAERDAKRTFMSPVMKRVHPYLRTLFLAAELTMDENLNIVDVKRQGSEEDFQLLSIGTQEQIAVLIRLAFAQMLVEQGLPATVILDDALVYSDDARMDKMFDILNVASDKIQVIILTCREKLFEGLGGDVLSLEPADQEDLQSA